MASSGDWPSRKDIGDLTAFVNSLEEKHFGHAFDMAFLDYKGIHYAVSRCEECQVILGVAPVPEEQYILYKVAYETVMKLDENQRTKNHQPTFHNHPKVGD